MGVNRDDYVIFGWKLPDNFKTDDGVDFEEAMADDWEMYDRIMEDCDEEYEFIRDGMNGEYIVFGKVLAYGEEYEGLGFTVVETDNLYIDALKKKVKKVLNYTPDTEPKVIAFTHWH